MHKEAPQGMDKDSLKVELEEQQKNWVEEGY
jgi:hypothetical protein